MRVKYLDVAPELLIHQYITGFESSAHFRVEEGLPADSQVVDAFIEGDYIRLTIESDEFPEVEPYGPAMTVIDPPRLALVIEEPEEDGLQLGSGDDESGADSDPSSTGSFPF